MSDRTNKANIADLREGEVNPVPEAMMMAPIAGAGEVGVSAAAARAKALVEAHYVIALRQKRQWPEVRQDILNECRRPGFAHNKSTYYVKPIGDGVEGLGIRFAEAALRCMKNVLVTNAMIYEDAEKEVHSVTVIDLENNIPYSTDVVVSKWVERSKAEPGTYKSVRKNSWGRNVYIVLGNEDDLLNKRGALISKALRTLALRIIPGDIQDEAENLIKQIRHDKAAEDPAGEQKRIIDAFNDINVRAGALLDYLGHSIETCSPAELVKLRGIYGAIRDGQTTWAEVMDDKDSKTPTGKPPAKDPAKAGNVEGSGTQAGEAGSKPAVTADGEAKAKAMMESHGVAETGDALSQNETAAPQESQPAEPTKKRERKPRGPVSME